MGGSPCLRDARTSRFKFIHTRGGNTEKLRAYIETYPARPSTTTTIELLFLLGEGLIHIDERLHRMATDQATFDAALSDFMSDLTSGLAAIQAKLDAENVPVDLSSELDQINTAKAAFDAQVAADTATAPATPAASGTDTAPADTTATDAAPAATEEF